MPLWKPINSKYGREPNDYEDMLQKGKAGAGKVMLKRMRDSEDRESMDKLTNADRKLGRKNLTAVFLDVAQATDNMLKDAPGANNGKTAMICDAGPVKLASSGGASSSTSAPKPEVDDDGKEVENEQDDSDPTALIDALKDILKDKNAAPDDILLVLEELQRVKVEVAVLQKTGVGKVVAQLRSMKCVFLLLLLLLLFVRRGSRRHFGEATSQAPSSCPCSHRRAAK